METKPIEFCGRTALNVLSAPTKQAVLDDLRARFGVAPLARRADVLTDKNASRVSESSSVIHAQSSGAPYVLFLTRVGFQEVALMIERRVRSGFTFPKILLVHVFFSERCFDGTVMAGELVRGRAEWMFLVDDVVAAGGARLSEKIFRDRYAEGMRILRESHRKCRTDPFGVYMKKFFQSNRLDELMAAAPLLPYRVRGVCVRSLGAVRRDVFSPLRVEQAERVCAKFIGPTAADDAFEVFASRDAADSEGLAAVPDLRSSQDLKGAFVGVVYGARLPYVCRWLAEQDAWVPVTPLRAA